MFYSARPRQHLLQVRPLMKRWFLCVCLATTTAAAAPLGHGKVPGFDRYKLIIERQPFGVVPPPATSQAPKTVSAADSFAKNLRITALLEVDDSGLKVGFVDNKSKKDYLMEVGDSEDGIEVVSANYENQEVVLRKDAEMVIVKLESGDVKTLNAAEQQKLIQQQQPPPPIINNKASEARIDSYIERRKARETKRQLIASALAQPTPTPTPAAKAQYTPEELMKKLQEYQEEAVRQGLPILPMPPVNEGTDNILAPEEATPYGN